MQADFCDKNLCFVYNQLQAAKVMLNLQERGYERIICYFAKSRFSETRGDGIKILSVRTLYKSTLFTIYAEFVLIFHWKRWIQTFYAEKNAEK